ncbi:MAG: hypothetical protein CYPHOPRED_003698 [Cyphobasidiales sp. Tagirdzhanova-0007]|nr:MAG: hypothetical protein CYPHOPRED_003698 [Cyphobasidiales sp. Tagirdzhanova-0007]
MTDCRRARERACHGYNNTPSADSFGTRDSDAETIPAKVIKLRNEPRVSVKNKGKGPAKPPQNSGRLVAVPYRPPASNSPALTIPQPAPSITNSHRNTHSPDPQSPPQAPLIAESPLAALDSSDIEDDGLEASSAAAVLADLSGHTSPEGVTGLEQVSQPAPLSATDMPAGTMPKRRKGIDVALKGPVKATKAISGSYPDWLTKQRRSELTKFLVDLNKQQLDDGHAKAIACGSANQNVLIKRIAVNPEAFAAAKAKWG